MTPQQAREAIYECFEAGWLTGPPVEPGGDPTALLPYTFDNEKFDTPAGPWVRLSVRHLDRRQVSLGGPGNRKFECEALVIIDYMEPPGHGVRATDGYLKTAADLFDARRIAGTTIRFGAAIPRERGLIENETWWAANAQVPFWYEEVK